MLYDEFGIFNTTIDEGVFYHKDYDGINFMKSSFRKEWIDTYIKDVKTIIDIGALDGGDSLRFNSWYKDANVYSIEGSPNNFNVINRKIGNRNNLKFYNYVISEKNEIVDFHLKTFIDFEHDGQMHMGSIYKYKDIQKFEHLSSEDSIKVESITFDRFCEMNNIESVDVIHVDIEGASYNLVLGMNKFLPKVVFLEKEGIEFFSDKEIGGNEELKRLLKSKGYELILDLGNDYLFILK